MARAMPAHYARSMMKSAFRQTFRCTAVCAGLSLLLPLAALAASEPVEYLWDGGVARGATVEIVNPLGDVFVQRSLSGRVELRALRTAATGDASLVEMRTARTDAGLVICSEAPSATFACVAGARPAPGSASYHVDELVQVPVGTNVVIRGQNGKIVIEDAQNETNVNGEVRVSIVGSAGKTLVYTVREGSVAPA